MDVIIRPAHAEDAAEVAAIRLMTGTMENIFALPSKRPDQMEESYQNSNRDQHEFAALLRQEGREQVIGAAGLSVGSGRGRHPSASEIRF